LVVDVRAKPECDRKRIPASLSVPLNHLAENLDTLPKDRPLLIHCAGGYRSSIAAGLLQSFGYPHVSEISGGIAAWEAAGLPVQTAQS
jgi:rhodanese-related sulfurtransferase